MLSKVDAAEVTPSRASACADSTSAPEPQVQHHSARSCGPICHGLTCFGQPAAGRGAPRFFCPKSAHTNFTCPALELVIRGGPSYRNSGTVGLSFLPASAVQARRTLSVTYVVQYSRRRSRSSQALHRVARASARTSPSPLATAGTRARARPAVGACRSAPGRLRWPCRPPRRRTCTKHSHRVQRLRQRLHRFVSSAFRHDGGYTAAQFSAPALRTRDGLLPHRARR